MLKIAEIEQNLKQIPLEAIEIHLKNYEKDERQGVQKLIEKYKKKQKKYEAEKNAWQLKLDFDAMFCQSEEVYIGIDEVGRGPLAGPVVTAAVILPKECNLIGLKDSKQLSEAKREELYERIKEVALSVQIGSVEADEIDSINILQATFKAMRQALEATQIHYDIIGVDGDKMIPKVFTKQHAIIKGDNKSAAIAAASVIAKVTRDRIMKIHAKTYTVYDWESNKGYGSQKHYDAIHRYGITPLHRKSFLKNEGIV